METLEIEDLKLLLKVIKRNMSQRHKNSTSYFSLMKSRAIIEQMIKDREFEQSQTTLPKL